MVVISVVTELGKENETERWGPVPPSTSWCGYAVGLLKCVCRNLPLDLLKSSWRFEVLLSVSSVVTRMN